MGWACLHWGTQGAHWACKSSATVRSDPTSTHMYCLATGRNKSVLSRHFLSFWVLPSGDILNDLEMFPYFNWEFWSCPVQIVNVRIMVKFLFFFDPQHRFNCWYRLLQVGPDPIYCSFPSVFHLFIIKLDSVTTIISKISDDWRNTKLIKYIFSKQ